MKDVDFRFSKYHRLLILLVTVCFNSNILAQPEKNTITKIEALKSKPDFSRENPIYIDLLLDLAKDYNYVNPDSTAILLKESYDLSVKSNYKKGECIAMFIYGIYYQIHGEKEKAYEYGLKALEIANAHNLRSEKITILNSIGINYWRHGNNANALARYLEALSIAKELGDTRMMSRINNNIALLYGDNGDYETALTFLEKSNQINQENNYEELLGRTLLNMAVLYIEKEDLISAKTIANRCIEIFNKEKSNNWLSHTYEVNGSIALKKNNYKEALHWYSKSEKICDEIDFTLGYTKTYIGMAESYLGLQNLEIAEEYALKALQLSINLDVREETKNANSILASIYHEKGEHKKAFEYQVEYTELYKKQSGEDYKKGLGVLRGEMQFENQKQLLVEENNMAIAEQKRYVYMAIAALLLSTLFLGLIYRTNKLQKRYTEELKNKQEVLIRRESELSQASKTKDKLFSVIAHDLKGPIGSFHSLMKLYSEEEISNEQSAYILPKALSEIQNISEMLNNLLLWGKIQLDGAKIKHQNININKIVKDNIVLLNPIAEKKNIKIRNTVAENTNSFSDRNYIDVVLRNLINNAIKFTNIDGEISICAIEKENQLQLEVKDNGIGMDVDTQAKLFEKSNYKSTFGTMNEKGTGLGLSLCKDMVESNGGKIWVSSIENRGTSIFFTVPVEKSNKGAT